jgi:hypothetical protein
VDLTMRINAERKESIKILKNLIQNIEEGSLGVRSINIHKSIVEGPPKDGFKTFYPSGEISITILVEMTAEPLLDKSDKADAEKSKWLWRNWMFMPLSCTLTQPLPKKEKIKPEKK